MYKILIKQKIFLTRTIKVIEAKLKLKIATGIRLWKNEFTNGQDEFTKGQIAFTEGHIEFTKGYIKATKGHIEFTKGYIKATKGHIYIIFRLDPCRVLLFSSPSTHNNHTSRRNHLMSGRYTGYNSSSTHTSRRNHLMSGRYTVEGISS